MKTSKNRSIKKRDIEEHVVDHTKIKQEGVGNWDATQGEVHSDVALELDKGHGAAAIIRSFDFKANPESFKNPPTKQELFNAHAAQIAAFLAQDGLKVIPEVNPQVKLSKDRQGYRIVVGASPVRGQTLLERPKTLTQIINGPESPR